MPLKKRSWLMLAAVAFILFVLSVSLWMKLDERADTEASGDLAARAENIKDEYGSLPKGVILEGAATGFAKIKTVAYEKLNNRFIINGTDTYNSPVPMENLVELLNALSKDRRIGVSLSKRERVMVFGSLSERGESVSALAEADKLLGYVTFGRLRKLKGVKLPGDYEPRVVKKRKIDAVCSYNFTNYSFRLEEGKYVKDGMQMIMTLVPISRKKAPNGGYLPDLEAAKKGMLEEADKANVAHINAYLHEYFAMPVVAGAVRHGEAVAFLRLLLQSGVNPEELLAYMK